MAKTNESGVWDQDAPGNGQAGSTIVKRTHQLAKAEVVRDDWDDEDEDDEEKQENDVAGEKAKASGNKTDGTMLVLGLTKRREGEAEEESSNIWEEANKRAPMPELIVAPASTSQSFPPPPPAAFQPTLRILKRPSPNISARVNHVGASSVLSSSGPTPGSGSGSGGTSPAPRGTLAEREAQYQEARSRIFGEKEKLGSASPGSMSRTSSSPAGVIIVRDPLEPASASEPELELEPEMGGQDKVHGPDRPARGFRERQRGKKQLDEK